MEDDYTTNTHYLTYTCLLERLGECTFEVDSERVKASQRCGFSYEHKCSSRFINHLFPVTFLASRKASRT